MRIGSLLIPAAEALLEAGARILQFRHKSFFSRRAFEEASRIAELCRSAGALFIVNDRADIAKLLDAGLHLGQDDLAPADARRILPAPSIIGFSTHNEEQLRAGDREPVDYLAIGPIFATAIQAKPRSGRRLRSVTRFAAAHAETAGRDRRHHARVRAAGLRSRSRFGGRSSAIFFRGLKNGSLFVRVRDVD